VLEIASDLGHMEIVTTGKVLPVLLRRSPLRAVKAPPKFVKPVKDDKKAEKNMERPAE
jgi:hypothetical protein